MTVQNILVIGLGKVGTLVATLLQQNNFHVTGMDTNQRDALPFKTIAGNAQDKEFLT